MLAARVGGNLRVPYQWLTSIKRDRNVLYCSIGRQWHTLKIAYCSSETAEKAIKRVYEERYK